MGEVASCFMWDKWLVGFYEGEVAICFIEEEVASCFM